MEQELKDWVIAQKKKLWDEYQAHDRSSDSVLFDCELLDKITNPPLN